jgi:hypothetical protein
MAGGAAGQKCQLYHSGRRCRFFDALNLLLVSWTKERNIKGIIAEDFVQKLTWKMWFDDQP